MRNWELERLSLWRNLRFWRVGAFKKFLAVVGFNSGTIVPSSGRSNILKMRLKSDPRIAGGTLVFRIQKKPANTNKTTTASVFKENPAVWSWFKDAFLMGPC